MQTLGHSYRTAPPARRIVPVSAVSVAAHVMLLLVLAAALRPAARLTPYKLPGTAQGTRLLTFYAPGSLQAADGAMTVKTPAPPKPKPAAAKPTVAALPTPPASQTASAEKGSANAALSGLGDGDISIALTKHFPRPAPDLASLPRGTHGDVIVNAVIDEQGNIADLTLLHGLSPAIDAEVLATVRTWTYAPATRNGQPVRSEQELHFHYERT